MPWSTWTTWSPTFRSRKSERKARAADWRRSDGAALLLEDVGLGEHLERRVGQAEPARERADGHEDGGGVRHLAARLDVVALARVDEHGDGDQLVVAQQLDDALGAAGRGGDEQHGLARLARAPDLLHPVADAPAELDGGLAAEGGWRPGRASGPAVARGSDDPRSTRPRPSSLVPRPSSIASSSIAVPSSNSAVTSSRGRRASPAAGTSAPRAMASRQLPASCSSDFSGARPHLVRLADEDERTRDVVEERGRSGRRRRPASRLAASGSRLVGSRLRARRLPAQVVAPMPLASRGRRRPVGVGSKSATSSSSSCARRARSPAAFAAAAASAPALRLPPRPVVVKHLPQRDDRDVLDLAGGALRGGVEVADRLDGVADEVEADGLRAARRGRCRSRRRGRRTRRARPPGPGA